MIKCTDMTEILGIEDSGVDMSQPYSEKSATELMEQALHDSEQVDRAWALFQDLLKKGKMKEATKVYWFALLNYNVNFSNE